MAAVKKRKVALSIWAGFALAALEMGLPMIGVSVNLWLGGLLLAAAFIFFALGLWNWETNHHYGPQARAITLIIIGAIYFTLMGFQIHSQYGKDHLPIAKNPPSVPTPPAKKCDGKTGDATANGKGSIANSGNCVDGLSTDQKSQ